MLNQKAYPWLVALAVCGLLASCQTFSPQPAPPPVEPTSSPPTATATPATPTKTPARTLVVCLGQEPKTLYPYAGSSPSMWSVLEAIYDGPFDTRNFAPRPVILQKVPEFADNSALLTAVDVHAGDEVVDQKGDLTTLAAGTPVLPSGCTGADCGVSWDGTSPLKMDQLKLTYKLLPNLKWSDGAALTAADSLYSYQLSGDPDTPVTRRVLDRTISYKLIDDLTIEWTGVPGDFPQSFDSRFWLPLPQHAWKDTSAKDLQTSDISNRKPLGWGPYMVDEWTAGDHIQLVKNPNYFRAAEGLPHFDKLVYRFLGGPGDNNLTALLNGECDIVDSTSLLDDQLQTILELKQSGKVKAYVGQGPEWEHLDFGIKPAAYDDGYAPGAGDRPDFFSDVRMRQGLTYCMDRQKIIDSQLAGQSSVPASFLPPNHPLFLADLKPLPFDPAQGQKLLDEAGWKDLDGNPATPRTSVAVLGLPDGIALALNYITTQAKLRVEVAKILTASLAQCGVQVNVQYLNPGNLYGPGPDGALFGRKFDLAQFAWEAGLQPACSLYASSQIPAAANHWTTVNVTGYSSPAYDAACEAARRALPGTPDYAGKNQAVLRLFAQELPSVPLYFRPKIAVSRPDLCGLELDVTARSALWSLEAIDYGDQCPK